MRRSTMTARLITSAIALVLTPIALILLSLGGQTMNLTLFAYGFDGEFGPLIGPLLLQTLGVVLLVVVVLTGVWSSAGLIVVGAFMIAPLIAAFFPVTLTWIYRVAPREWVDGLVYGLPLVILAALGAMGLVLALIRRDPRPKGGALSAIGVVVAPLLLAAGAWAITWGIAEGVLFALQRFQFDLRPDAASATIVGTLLVIVGITVSRWSPFALVLPGVALLVGSVVMIAAPRVAFDLLVALPRSMNTLVPSLLLYGGGAAAGLMYLTFTAVLLRVRAQSRLTDPRAAGPGDETDSPYPGALYAPTQYAQAQHPPTQHPHAPAAGPQPPAAPYPPQPGA
ncbi:hypothetical protein AB0O14_08585 [Microbacterium foliorum]